MEACALSVADTIRSKLGVALDPERLEITDESHRHVGHAGARPQGETHFRISVVSSRFHGLSRVVRQRLVYRALAADMVTDIHALALTTLTPEEHKSGHKS